MKNKSKKLIAVISLITLLIIASGSWFIFFNTGESFVSATTRCGYKPVIGSRGVFYVPGSENNDLLSMYDPANLNLADYPKAKFFCSEAQAKQAGYHAHECCGLVIPINKQ